MPFKYVYIENTAIFFNGMIIYEHLAINTSPTCVSLFVM